MLGLVLELVLELELELVLELVPVVTAALAYLKSALAAEAAELGNLEGNGLDLQ